MLYSSLTRLSLALSDPRIAHVDTVCPTPLCRKIGKLGKVLGELWNVVSGFSLMALDKCRICSS